jgi:hypothetical protein
MPLNSVIRSDIEAENQSTNGKLFIVDQAHFSEKL